MRTTVKRMRSPVHPREFIRAEILEPLDLTVTAAAQVLQVTRPALSSLPAPKSFARRLTCSPRGEQWKAAMMEKGWL